MLSTAARARLTVVLVGARNPSNIGAAARAMQDFGFSDLRIANDFAAPFEAARLDAHLEAQLEARSAVAAQHVMRSARRYDTLAAAIADCTLVVATTAIGERQLTQPILPLQRIAPKMLEALSVLSTPPTRVALLFGSEKTGLTNDQLSHASLLTTIPMYAPEGSRHLSMNLGQSVAVCLYELTRLGFESSIEIPPPQPSSATAPSTAQDRERLTQLLLDVFHATGYTRRYPANVSEPLVRQLALQLGSSHREAMTWMGILRQILWQSTHAADGSS